MLIPPIDKNYPPYVPIPTVQPFTYRDGVTYWEKLNYLIRYIKRYVLPYIDAGDKATYDQLIAQFEKFTDQVNDKIADINDIIQAIVDNSIIVQDPLVAQMINDINSDTRQALDGIYGDSAQADQIIDTDSDTRIALDNIYGKELIHTKEFNDCRTSVWFDTGVANSDSHEFNYIVIKINTNGKYVPGIISKRFADDYETYGTSGVNFIPPKESLLSVSNRTGAYIVVNGSAADVNTGEMKGAQIKDGVIYHDLSSAYWQDAAATAILNDGTIKTYSVFNGDTAQTMVADGVVDSWSFGPPAVVDGTVFEYWNDPAWSTVSVNTSARTLLGQTDTGDILIVQVEGVSGEYGIVAKDCGYLMHDLGCVNAGILDGGGSAQSLKGNIPILRSSDNTNERSRPDFILVNAPCNSDIKTGWRKFETNITGYEGFDIKYSRVNDDVSIIGNGPVQDIPTGNTNIGTGFPHEYCPSEKTANGSSRWSGGYPGAAYLTPSGNLGVTQQSGGPRNGADISINFKIG